MKTTTHKRAAELLVLTLSLGSAALAAEVPLGHKEFYPSPERPVGFRGDFTGNFPGATPVTEFWEAPHFTVSNPPPAKAPFPWPNTVTDLDTNHPAHNIVWKTKMPGWSLTHPLVVGDKVLATAEPHFVLCLDAHTGKLLWQREALPLLAALAGEPPVGEKRARELQEILEIARASDYLLPNFGNDPAHYERVVSRVQEWRTRVATIDPDAGVLAAFDKVLAQLAEIKAIRRSFPRVFSPGWRRGMAPSRGRSAGNTRCRSRSSGTAFWVTRRWCRSATAPICSTWAGKAKWCAWIWRATPSGSFVCRWRRRRIANT